MEFPTELRTAIENRIEGMKQESMKLTARTISERYRNESGAGRRLVSTDDEAGVYSLVRMPATFGAVYDTLSCAAKTTGLEIESMIDAGAGTGAGSWAASYVFPLKSIVCLERESAMRSIGKALMQSGDEVLRHSRWEACDLVSEDIEHRADMVVSSYVMNEMSREDREKVLLKLWAAADKMLVVIEPGTPEGYSQLKRAREILLSMGAHLAAPCPHEKPCRLADDDWCHFTTRIQRSKLHKQLKMGEVPYEDEKFSYMVFTREAAKPAGARILRHPYIEKGRITLDICTAEGNKRITVRKSDGGLFKLAKKAKCGGSIEKELLD